MRKYNWKKILTRTLWGITGAGAIVLLGAAMQRKNQKKCADINIEITGAEQHMFIDEQDVLDMLNIAGRVEGSRSSALNLRSMETMVEKNPWVKNAEMFLDNKQVLQVRIEERQPVARVFTMEGSSFYLDSNAMRLPLSDKISARVPVFTGFPSDQPVLSKPDSALLFSVAQVGRYILADSFWMAQVAQVDITSQAGFELVPVIGDHIVVLGAAEDLDNKFKRLYTFYKKAWLQNGINRYEKLDVQYNNQVVAIQRGIAKALSDSIRAKEIMDGMLSTQPGINDMSTPVMPAPEAPAKTVKDSATVPKKSTTVPAVKPATTNNRKTVTVTNNKTTDKPLSKEKKTATPVKKDIPKGKSDPKAVMKKP